MNARKALLALLLLLPAAPAWAQSPIQSMMSGTVNVKQGTSPWVDNITQFGGTNLSTGTGASGAGIPRVTVANDSNILATQSGTWTVQQGTPPWSVSQSGAPWTTTIQQGGNNATVNASGQLTVNCAAGCGATSFAGTLNVAAPTSGSLSADIDILGNLQALKQANTGGLLVHQDTPGLPPSRYVLSSRQTPTAPQGPTYSIVQPNQQPSTQHPALVVTQSPTPAPVCTSTVSFSTAGAGRTKIITGVAGQRIFICGVVVVANAAGTFSLQEGTGGTCGTGTAAVLGFTSTNGDLSFAANGGLSSVAASPWTMTQTSGDDVCTAQTAVSMTGTVSYIQR